LTVVAALADGAVGEPRYDESLWKGAVDLSGRTLRTDCVHRLLERGVTVARFARAEVRSYRCMLSILCR